MRGGGPRPRSSSNSNRRIHFGIGEPFQNACALPKVRHEGAERRSRLTDWKQPCCMRDGGGPSGDGLQDQFPNHPALRGDEIPGGERIGKRRGRPRQVRIGKANASEPPMSCRKVYRCHRNQVTGRGLGISPAGTCLLAGRWPADRRREPGSGFHAERGNLALRCKGRSPRGRNPEDPSTDAERRGGSARSSVEAW